MSLRAASQILNKTKNVCELEIVNNKSPSAVRSGRKSCRVNMTVLLSFEEKKKTLARAHNRDTVPLTLHHWEKKYQVWTSLSEPNGVPQNVTGQNTSSTIISVSWKPIQSELQNGVITGYNITYQSQTENDNGFVEAGPNDRRANLTGLKEFVKYNISVVAFTVKGNGPSSVIIVRTDEDSKWSLSVKFFHV